MNWEALGALVALLSVLSTVVTSWVTLNLRATIAEQRVRDVEARSAEREELKTWINGSFMRAKLVQAELDAFAVRIEHLEQKRAA